MNRAVERVLRGFVFDAFEDDARFAHRSADKTLLARERGRSAFADDPVVFAAVRFAPGEIVMVVNFFDDFCPENFRHALADPIASRIRVFTGEPACHKTARKKKPGYSGRNDK